MKRLAVLLIVLAATPARAEQPLVGTIRKVSGLWSQAESGEIRRKLDQAREQIEAAIAVGNAFLQNNAPLGARLDALAELGAGLDGTAGAGQGTLGLVFGIQGPTCDVVQLGASLRADLRTSEPRSLGGAQQWFHLCLGGGLDVGSLMKTNAGGIAIFPMVLRESATMLARPRLTAPRAAIDETYSDIGYGFDVEGARWRWRKNGGGSFIGVTVDQRYRWRKFFGGDDHRVEIGGEFWFFRLFTTRDANALADRAVDILVFGFHGIQADNGAAIVGFWPVRFTGISPSGSDGLLVDAELGIGGTGTVSSSTTGPGVNEMVTIDTTGLPEVSSALAHVAIHSGDPHRYLSVAYDRTLDTNVLADVVREDRFTLSGSLTDLSWIGRAAAFVSRSRYYLDESVNVNERVAGLAVTTSYTLAHDLQLGVTLEGVVGLHERDEALDGHALPRGLRAFVTFGTTKTLWSY